MFSEPRARRVTQFIEGLKHTKGEFHGKPFKLLPWQKTIIRDVFGTVRDDDTTSVHAFSVSSSAFDCLETLTYVLMPNTTPPTKNARTNMKMITNPTVPSDFFLLI